MQLCTSDRWLNNHPARNILPILVTFFHPSIRVKLNQKFYTYEHLVSGKHSHLSVLTSKSMHVRQNCRIISQFSSYFLVIFYLKSWINTFVGVFGWKGLYPTMVKLTQRLVKFCRGLGLLFLKGYYFNTKSWNTSHFCSLVGILPSSWVEYFYHILKLNLFVNGV